MPFPVETHIFQAVPVYFFFSISLHKISKTVVNLFDELLSRAKCWCAVRHDQCTTTEDRDRSG